MRFRAPLTALFVCFSVLAAAGTPVAQVIEFVRSSIKLKQPDKQVADTLHRMKLSEKLNDRDIEALQGEGAGPKTIAALRELSAASGSLPAAPPPPPPVVYKQPDPPPYEKQQQIITEAREYALNYTSSMPDYICNQITDRFQDPLGKDNWRHADKIAMRLTYNGKKENYQLLTVNGQMINKPIDPSGENMGEVLGGTTATGQFASMLKFIFEPRSSAEFHWEKWARLRNRICYVFNYLVDQPHSDWGIYDGVSKQSIRPAYRGLVFIDKQSGEILRVTLNAFDIPPDFPINVATIMLDYDWADISGHKFLLPLRSEEHVNRGVFATKNEDIFHGYRKFSADATITFDDVNATLDESKTKEQPLNQTPPK